MDEITLIRSRLEDLAAQCGKYAYPVYSKFLTVPQQSMAKAIRLAGVCCQVWGGWKDSERAVAAFYPDYMKPENLEWNFCALEIVLTDGAVLSHRDYLGAMLSLGLKRETIGDILAESGRAVIFCLDEIAVFLEQNLDKVGGSRALVKRVSFAELKLPQRQFKILDGTVASLRLDAFVSFVTGKSRTTAAQLITSGLVQLNFTECKQGAKTVKEGDIFSVRGYGKFVLAVSSGQTRKGRESIQVKKYI